jgi:diaminopimelate epimerase
MRINFSKYQGAGNDFIMIVDAQDRVSAWLDDKKVAHLCHRRFGIGADGLILLKRRAGYDFEMIYYNSDGNQSSMCGNGGRCIVAFAARVGWIKREANFLAVDGAHKGILKKNLVALQMQAVSHCANCGKDWLLNTGSPHYVKLVKNLSLVAVEKEGKAIRYNEQFAAEGVNVNFVEASATELKVATYERGVESETWACGTGAVAAAIVANHVYKQKSPVVIHTKGGELGVKFAKTANGYEDIWLEGGAEWVFDGIIEMD